VRVCRVRPDVPAVTREFDYLVPEALTDPLGVGTIVRVPLHGRRVRGWVVADDVVPATPVDRLVPVHAVVSAGPPPAVVDLARWAAHRWAGPLTAFLRAASPPSVVPAGAPVEATAALHPVAPPPADLGGPWPDAPVRVVTWPPAADRRALVLSLCAAEGTTLVLVPEPAGAGPLVRAVARTGRTVLHHHSALTDRVRTQVWAAARRGAQVVVGGRAAVWLPIPDLAAVVVLDERDEAYQEERAPTWQARDVAVERAARAGAVVTLVSPVPGPEAVARPGAVLVTPPERTLRRGWPVLDVVDLRDEPPRSGVAGAGLGAALDRAVAGGGRALVVVNRRGRARLLACRACATLARCEVCAAALAQPDDVLECPRCGTTRPPVCGQCGATRVRAVRPGVHAVRDEIAGLVPRVPVTDVDAATDDLGDAPVLVGTEAVLHRLARGGAPPVRLVAFPLFDEELCAPRHRAHEQALWLLVRAARLLGERTRGGRLVVQTRMPDHPVLAVARTGDPAAFLAAETEIRRALAHPPFGAVAEVSGAPAAVTVAVGALRAAGLTVVGGESGPALVRAPTVDALADVLGAADLGPARARGRLRVAVDPPRV
jgi:primosomal protein N' (replication factor Y)